MSASPMVEWFQGVARLARATALFTFGLIVLGAIVRSTGSGLACPDWPLCHGRLLPPLQPQVLLEWSHRAVALVVSVLTLALGAWIFAAAPLRRVLGRWMLLALGLLALQIVLGALTVWKLLHFSVVTLHLGNALLFLAALVAVAERAAGEGTTRAGSRSPTAALWWAVVAATLVQILLGGLVSTNHAGLACPDFPGCHGAWWPAGTHPLEHLQMIHRWGAYALSALLLVAWARTRRGADLRVRAGAEAALGLVAVQIVLGAFNVLLAVPVWLTAAHLATATALWMLVVLNALRSGAPTSDPVPGRTRESSRRAGRPPRGDDRGGAQPFLRLLRRRGGRIPEPGQDPVQVRRGDSAVRAISFAAMATKAEAGPR